MNTASVPALRVSCNPTHCPTVGELVPVDATADVPVMAAVVVKPVKELGLLPAQF